MQKVYYIKSCNTCMRILKELKLPPTFKYQDIKEHPLTKKDIEAMYGLSQSFESLFSRRAKLYTEMGLKNEVLDEQDFKHYLMQHYTFLKRPVIINHNEIFIGSASKTIEAARRSVHGE